MLRFAIGCLLWWWGAWCNDRVVAFSLTLKLGVEQYSQPARVRRGQWDSSQLKAAFGTSSEQLWRWCEVQTLDLLEVAFPQEARKQEPGRSSSSTEFTEENLAFPPSVCTWKASKWPASLPLMGATKASLHEVVGTYWGDVGLRYLFPVSLNTWPVSKFRKSLLTVNPKRKSKIAWSTVLGIISWRSSELWLLTRDCLHGHDQALEHFLRALPQ